MFKITRAVPTEILGAYTYSISVLNFRFLKKHPDYVEHFPSYDSEKPEEDIKGSFEFENDAMEIFGLFDDVVNNLEEVDKALSQIRHEFSANEKIPQLLKVRLKRYRNNYRM